MKRLLLLALAAPLLSGCAGFTAYVHAHAATIGAIGMVAGAIAATEGAVVNAIELKEKVAP